MSNSPIIAFVTKADRDMIGVRLLDESYKKELIEIGFSFDFAYDEYTLVTSGNNHKSEIFQKLRDLDVAFCGGKEWCPSEVFEYLRESGLLSGNYTKITWSNPKSYHCTCE